MLKLQVLSDVQQSFSSPKTSSETRASVLTGKLFDLVDVAEASDLVSKNVPRLTKSMLSSENSNPKQWCYQHSTVAIQAVTGEELDSSAQSVAWEGFT
eukprot:3192234-Amphidinium_carterae.1